MNQQAEPAPGSPSHKATRKELNGKEKLAVYLYLVDHNGATKGKLKNGLVKQASERFGISEAGVTRIWGKGKARDPDDPESFLKSLSPPKKGRVGKKRRALPLEEIMALPANKRRTVRCLAKHIGIPKSTIQDNIKKKFLLRNTNSVKPAHTDMNILQRLEHCLSCIMPETIATNPRFSEMSDIIHLDEKWFQLFEETERCIIVPGETVKNRSTKSKRYIGKLMFLSAIGRPRYDPVTRECRFNGKYGIWPFIELVPAARGSRYRPRGTIEIKPVDVNRNVYFDMLISEFIPSVLTKHPNISNLESPITAQQDNAKPHIFPDDVDFVSACEDQGLLLRMVNQPPNSPDFNINDLGLFRALDAKRLELESNNLEELIENIKATYASYPADDINKLWLSYQQCMIESLKVQGTNRYKLPHMKKDKLLRDGNLPTSLHIPLDLVQNTIALIEEKRAALGIVN